MVEIVLVGNFCYNRSAKALFMYILLALVGYIILAVVGILDKFILSKAVPKPIIFAFYSSIFVLPIFFLIPFGVSLLYSSFHWIIAFVSGVAFMGALWAMYQGFEEGEVSHMGPLIGSVSPFFVVVFGALFLEELLTAKQLAAVAILIIGSLIISVYKGRRHYGLLKGAGWGIAAGLFFAVSHVAAKYIYDIYGFYTGFVWTRGAVGAGGLLLLFAPSVRASFKWAGEGIRRERGFFKFMLVSADKILGVIGVIIVQYAIARGSVSVVNALAGVQYAVLVILVAVLSAISPRLFREKYERRELRQELLAVLVIALGLGVLLI